MARRKTKNKNNNLYNRSKLLPIKPLLEVTDYGGGEWEVEAIVGEHRLFHGRTYYKVAWKGWTDPETGENTTWEDEAILDEENRHFLDTWKQSATYREIDQKAKIDPLEVPVTFLKPTVNEENLLQEAWRSILRREDRDKFEELPFMAQSLFTTAHDMDFKNGNLKKIENWKAGLVPDPPPQKRAWLIRKSKEPNLGRLKETYAFRRAMKEREKAAAQKEGGEEESEEDEMEERMPGRSQRSAIGRRTMHQATNAQPTLSTSAFNSDDDDIDIELLPQLRRRPVSSTQRGRGSETTGPRGRPPPRPGTRNESSTINAVVKEEQDGDATWKGVGQHSATLVIDDDEDDEGRITNRDDERGRADLCDVIMDGVNEERTIDYYTAKWNDEIVRVGAAPLNIVNEIDDEPPIPHGVFFEYIENKYLYTDDIPRDQRPEGVKDFLGGCNHPGLCTVENGCECRTSGYEDQNIYNEEGLVTIDFPPQNNGITECNIHCKCRNKQFPSEATRENDFRNWKGKGREKILDSCTNRVAQSSRKYPLELFKTNNGRGWGVRCIGPIPKGAVLGLYTGLVAIDSDPIVREQPASSYSFDLVDRDEDELNENEDEDPEGQNYAVSAYNHGNWTRFVNHSCNPVARSISIIYDTLPIDSEGSIPKLAFVTKRALAPRTEITIDYDPLHSHLKGKRDGGVMCQCGANNCRGMVYVGASMAHG